MQTYPFGGGSTRLHVGYGTGGICAEVEKEQEGGQGGQGRKSHCRAGQTGYGEKE